MSASLTQRFTVTANGHPIGEYEAQSPQEACDLAARDAGYHSVVDMEDRLDQPSALVAEAIAARDECDRLGLDAFTVRRVTGQSQTP